MIAAKKVGLACSILDAGRLFRATKLGCGDNIYSTVGEILDEFT